MGSAGKILKREVSRLIAWLLLLLTLVLYPLLLAAVSLTALVFHLKGGVRLTDRGSSGGEPGA